MRPLKSHFRDNALTILKAVLTQLSAVCHCHQGSGNLISTHAQENVMTSVVTQQRERDGRPLYAYKLRDSEYEQLKVVVREQMPGALRGRADHRFAAMFCVYAAETFRLRHTGGPWTWETVFDEIGHATPNYQAILPG